jgi:hypothetical protein
MAKLKIFANCNFKLDRVMELANLIQRVYEQHNNYQNSPYWESLVSTDKLVVSIRR